MIQDNSELMACKVELSVGNQNNIEIVEYK